MCLVGIKMYLFYTEEDIFSFNKSIETIIFSKDMRRLKSKTQLFSTGNGDHFRNRMTHTLEVLYVSKNIGRLVEEYFKEHLGEQYQQVISFELLEAIALSHDLGHTPFGHIGERTLRDILMREDSLGGLIHHLSPESSETKDQYDLWQKMIRSHSFFKHNANSVSILMDNDVTDWRIIDGVLKHTDISYQKGVNKISVEELNWLKYLINNTPLWHIYFPRNQTEISAHALTLEGQIVAIADEIAQKYSDFDDMVRDNINLKLPNGILAPLGNRETLNSYNKRLILAIKDHLIKSAVTSFERSMTQQLQGKDLAQIKQLLQRCDMCYFDIYSDPEAMGIKKTHTARFAEIEKIRRFDGKSKHIVRQLFKAYYNSPELLDKKTRNRILEEYRRLTNKSEVSFSECVKDMKKINRRVETDTRKFIAGNIFLKHIAQHISYMTDDFALMEYKELYL